MSQSQKKSVGQVNAITISELILKAGEVYLTSIENGEEVPSILLLGKPGVGKTVGLRTLAKVLADVLDKEFVDLKREWWRYDEVMANPEKYFAFLDFSVTHVEPTDLSGFPRTDGKDYVSYLPLEYVKLFSNPKAFGMLFLDEITLDNRVDRKSAEYKILDEHQFGFRTLSPTVMLVAAGNTDKDISLAEPLPDPILRGRVMRFYIRPPTVDEWIQFMNEEYGDRWDNRVGVFLKRWPDLLWVQYQDDAGYDPRASPRNWTKLAVLLYCMNNSADGEKVDKLRNTMRKIFGDVRTDDTVLIDSLISGNEAQLFKDFIATQVPSLDELKVNVNIWKQLSLEAKYLITSMLSQRSLDELSEKYVDVLYVMSEVDREFIELLKNLLPREKRTQFVTRMARRHPRVFKALSDARHTSVDFGLEG
jgi:hypothetical protein